MHAPLTQAFRVEWQELSSLAAIAGEWRALAGRAVERNIFYEPDFLLAAAPVFGAGAGATLIWSNAGRLLGLFPARVSSFGPFAIATGWTHPYAPLGTPLVDGDHAAAVTACWLDHYGRDPSAPSLLQLPLVPEHGAFAMALDAVLARSGRANARTGQHGRAMLAPGAGRKDYLDRAMASRRRKELRRQRRRLEDSAPVMSAICATAPDIAAALDEFFALEAGGWKGRADTAAANHPAIKRFIDTAVNALAAQGQASVARLVHDDHAIAAAIVLSSGASSWFWKIAYHEDLARFSPGAQLTIDLTKHLLADPRIEQVDSCAVADHPMIDHIWRERLALSDRLIELRASYIPFALVRHAVTWRGCAIAAAKAVRGRLRGQ